MSADDKNDQSVMLSLDDLLAQDPSLGSLKGDSNTSSASGVDQKALDQIGLNQNLHRPAAPMTTAGIPLRHGDLKAKRNAGNILGYFAAVIGVIALVGVGVFIGSMNTPTIAPRVTPVPKASPTPSTNMIPTKLEPTPVANAIVAAPAQESKVVAKPIASPKTKTRANRSRRRAKVAPKPTPKPQSEPQVQPTPKPQPKPQPKPKVSEANSLLSGLKNGRSKSQSPSVLGDESDQKKSNLPTKLGRSEILSTMKKNQRSIARCRTHVDGRTKVKMRIVIAGSGQVTNAALIEPENLKSSKVASCMSERVQRYKFPQFSSRSMTVKLPFIL